MKCLRLDGTKRDAIRVALCIKGSIDYDDEMLTGIHRQFFIYTEMKLQPDFSSFPSCCAVSTALIPIGNIRFDMFEALRHQIIVRGTVDGGTEWHVGKLDAVYVNHNHAARLIDESGKSHNVDIVELCLTAVERGEYDGVTIEEVE